MNNLTFGGVDPQRGTVFAYYETIGGGSGASAEGHGETGIHCHMSNTLNTPVEALEMAFPIRLQRYAVRRGSGGAGAHCGGDGLERDIEFLAPARVTILSDRRRYPPYGLRGGQPGACGSNRLMPADGSEAKSLSGKVSLQVQPGDVLSIHTPGGGGWNPPGDK
jgi:N-methylhydantoinase B